MTKEEVLKYVMKSPENTNPAVLEGMLDQMGGSSNFETATVTFDLSMPSNTHLIFAAGGVYPGIDIDNILYSAQTPIIFNSLKAQVNINLNEGKGYIFGIGCAPIDPKAGSIMFNPDVQILSGNISYNDENEIYTITGDCTISDLLICMEQN